MSEKAATYKSLLEYACLAILVLLVALFATRCELNRQPDVESIYQAAYSKGYDTGHSDGFDEGYDTGHNDGFDDGYNEGYDDGAGIDSSEIRDKAFSGGFVGGYLGAVQNHASEDIVNEIEQGLAAIADNGGDVLDIFDWLFEYQKKYYSD